MAQRTIAIQVDLAVVGLAMPYPNVNTTARSDIEDADYDWKELVDNVSTLCIEAIHEVHPEQEENTWTFFNTTLLRNRIKKDPYMGRLLYPMN